MDIILEACVVGIGKAAYFLIADVGAIIFLKWGYPLLKQKVGRREVRGVLEKLPDGYLSMNDLVFKVAREVHRVDHLVVTPYGIFIIKAKYHEGRIDGNSKEQYWARSTNGKKARFYNPVWQNRGHIQALKKVLKDYPGAPYSSIVAFSRRAELEGVSSDTPVVYFDQIQDEILKKQGDEGLNRTQMESIAWVLQRHNVTDKTERRRLARRRSQASNKTGEHRVEELRLS